MLWTSSWFVVHFARQSMQTVAISVQIRTRVRRTVFSYCLGLTDMVHSPTCHGLRFSYSKGSLYSRPLLRTIIIERSLSCDGPDSWLNFLLISRNWTSITFTEQPSTVTAWAPWCPKSRAAHFVSTAWLISTILFWNTRYIISNPVILDPRSINHDQLTHLDATIGEQIWRFYRIQTESHSWVMSYDPVLRM